MAGLQSSISTKGTLTGSGTKDTIVTAGASSLEETIFITVRNANAALRTVSIYLNGTTAAELVGYVILDTGESFTLKESLASSDVLRMEGSGSDLNWRCVRRIVE